MDATHKPVTQDSIRSLLLRSDAAVEEALLRLYERQTQDEKQTRDAKHRNHRGFSGRDAAKGTKYAQWILGMRRDHGANPGEGLRRADHKTSAREITLRYTRQLLEVVTEKAAKASPTRDVVVLTDADAFADEAAMDAIVRKGELEENRRVAEFKARRDERLQEPAFAPGTRVTTRLFWGYNTLAELELSGTIEGDHVRVRIGTVTDPGSERGNVVHTGLVMAAGRMDNGTAANRVLFRGKSVWVRTFSLQRVMP